ncbi:Trp biosynthesis-associated membrane protein [Intrasporangium calvum]|uniref:Trp biosynthesis-associated membrane protein n=1 Tax=Intrasporangium calvum TaxID=53358 RepID=UPI000DF6124A|nr:Trp biosynthesis-associated membrane protein [Intrasporangium calvum]AXG13218.1 Trp biosynthesis protein [Intrasporangium calvum]
MTSRFSGQMVLGKRRSALVVALPAVALIGLATQPWARGRTGDVLSAGAIDVTGGRAAPGAVGLAVICVISLLALMSGGRVIRAVSGAVLVLSAAGALVLVLRVALRPAGVVAGALSQELARTTAPDATGATTAWGWAAAVVGLLLLVGSLGAARSSRHWAGLSARYERAKPASGPRGEVRTAWDELSDGADPTLRDGPDPA